MLSSHPYPPAAAAAASTRRVCLRACGAALWLADATARRCVPPNPLPPPVPRYAVVTHSAPRRRPSSATSPPLLPMPRRPCHPVRQCRRPPPISLLPLLLDSTLSPFPRLTPYPPAKQWKKNSFVQQTAYSPLPRPQHPQRGSPFVCPTPGLSPFRSFFPPHFPPETQVSVVFSIPPQSATSRWRPLERVQRMQRVYDKTARVPARKAGKFSIFPDTPLSPFLLYFAYGNPNPSEGSVRIPSPRQIGGLNAQRRPLLHSPLTARTTTAATASTSWHP
ncbi:hypothetical protein DFH08DRAFT_340166 [Mycena albidolilacea]|uniref:Uncharacterized protein n=1 Tax=Mycena albidolilacea TaxID=1033008 RepID=A0AAD6ZKR4_9AGAR|nr:hypothetical protein DFH08DRAFT_340166 [Mycena albidolilacea]